MNGMNFLKSFSFVFVQHKIIILLRKRTVLFTGFNWKCNGDTAGKKVSSSTIIIIIESDKMEEKVTTQTMHNKRKILDPVQSPVINLKGKLTGKQI